MSLASIAQELTEPHMRIIGGRIGKVPALLTELQEAIGGSSDTGTGGSTSKTRILVNANALALRQDIEDEIRLGYANRYEDAAPNLETCITNIGNSTHEPDWEQWFTEKLQWAKDQIETMLRPKKLRRLDGIECPSCQQKVFGEERETCLYADCWADNENLKHPTEWSVSCKACAAQWTGQKDIAWLLVALS